MAEKCKGGQILLLFLPWSQMFACYCAMVELIHTLRSQEAALEIQRGRTGLKPAASVSTTLMECPLILTLTDSYFQEGKKVREDTEIVTLTVLLNKLTKWVCHKKQTEIKTFVCSKQSQWVCRISLENLWEININA